MADPANVFAARRHPHAHRLRGHALPWPRRADVAAAIDRYYRADSDLDDLTPRWRTPTRRTTTCQRQGGRRGRADRQVRQPADHPGDPGPRLRHPPRADRARPAGPLPHRRRAARGHALAEVDPVRRDQPPQDHGRHQHRRAAHPAGRPPVGQRQRQEDRPPRRDPARRCGARRSSCESWTTRRPASTCPTSASARRNYDRYSRELHQALRDDPGHRPDRFGQVDDALRDAQHRQPARGQHHHGRGPGRVPAAPASTRCRSTPRPASPSPRRCGRSCGPTPTSCSSVRSATTRRRRSPIEAALTGHLVLSTLHTNDAPSAITRLIEMGIEPFLVGSAVDCVLAQRLARRLCSKCKEAYTPDRRRRCSTARYPWQDGEALPTLFRPVGCSACSKTGYKGRLALHEVMPVTEEIERLAVEHASATADRRGRPAPTGMATLRDDGMAQGRPRASPRSRRSSASSSDRRISSIRAPFGSSRTRSGPMAGRRVRRVRALRRRGAVWRPPASAGPRPSRRRRAGCPRRR